MERVESMKKSIALLQNPRGCVWYSPGRILSQLFGLGRIYVKSNSTDHKQKHEPTGKNE
jgi:hypothetical protein